MGNLPIVKLWGGGLLASVDGLRFVVPVQTINAGPSPKYFGYKRGITLLNAVNDQVMGIGQMVVPGTPRDSLFILDTLINIDAGPKPEVVTTDQASDSDMVFGIFSMLGYRFAPRFADLGDQRLWRAEVPGSDVPGDYGPLEAIARNRVNRNKIHTQWSDMTRVAGSLVTSPVRAYDLLRMFARNGRPTPLGQAFAEYGRIDKSSPTATGSKPCAARASSSTTSSSRGPNPEHPTATTKPTRPTGHTTGQQKCSG